MTRRSLRLLASLGALLLLAGCYHMAPGPYAPDFGEAVRHNMDMHIVDPEAGLAEVEAPELDGARGALAIGRYRADQVKEPRAIGVPGL